MYQRIKELRDERKLTTAEAAKALGICEFQYVRYETGACDIPGQIFIRLSRFYQVSVDYIVEFSDSRNFYNIEEDI